MAGNLWLRVVIYKPESSLDEATEYMRSGVRDVLARLRTLPGFGSGYWGEDPHTGTMAAVTYWRSR
jgi:hypothetical protein